MMFDPVLDWLGRAMVAFGIFIRSTLGKVVALLLAPLVAFFGLIMKLVSILESRLSDFISNSLDGVGAASSLNFGTALGMANYFVPLDTIFECSAILIGIWIIAICYRAVKSFIPTLS